MKLFKLMFLVASVGTVGVYSQDTKRNLEREHMNEWVKKQQDGGRILTKKTPEPMVGRRLGPPYCGDCGNVHCTCEHNDDTDDGR